MASLFNEFNSFFWSLQRVLCLLHLFLCLKANCSPWLLGPSFSEHITTTSHVFLKDCLLEDHPGISPSLTHVLLHERSHLTGESGRNSCMVNPLLESLSDLTKCEVQALCPFSHGNSWMDSVPAKRNPIVWDFSIDGRHIKILLWLQIQATFPNLSKKKIDFKKSSEKTPMSYVSTGSEPGLLKSLVSSLARNLK